MKYIFSNCWLLIYFNELYFHIFSATAALSATTGSLSSGWSLTNDAIVVLTKVEDWIDFRKYVYFLRGNHVMTYYTWLALGLGFDKMYILFRDYYFVTIIVIIIILGRYSKNQNGNLRWHLPWRGGGGRDRSRVPHTYFEKWFLLKTI